MEITKPELQNFKINPEDVWKEFNCPKYVTHLCFKTTKLPKEIFDFDRKLKLDTHRILQKLDELISDPVTSDSVFRICRLLFDFLNEVGDDGYVSFNEYIYICLCIYVTYMFLFFLHIKIFIFFIYIYIFFYIKICLFYLSTRFPYKVLEN